MYWSRLLRNSQRFGWKQPESPVSFSSAPVLLWQDCDYRGSDSSALPTADLHAQQLVSITSVEITLTEGVSLGATNSFSRPSGYSQTLTASKKCFLLPFNTVWTKLLILGMRHKSLSSRIQVSVSFQSLPLKFYLIYLKFNDTGVRWLLCRYLIIHKVTLDTSEVSLFHKSQ